MKILMLTPYLPYPPASGGQIRTLNLLKYLSKNHHITLISLYKNDREKKYVSHLKSYCDRIYECKRPEKPWQLSTMFKSTFSFLPFLIVRNYSTEARKIIETLLEREHFDVIHAETFYIMPHIPETITPILLVEQTIEFKVYQHFISKLPSLVRGVLLIDILKLKFWEMHYWKKATVVATVSEFDQLVIKKLTPKINPVIISNGAGDEMFVPQLSKKEINPPILLFVGNFYWLQNIEAAQYLITKLFPPLKKKLPNLNLIVGGQNAKAKISQHYSSSDIHIVDIPQDGTQIVQELYQKASLFVAPIFGPGGTRLKILAAMASGLPVVSTQTGVEGLEVKNGKHALIAQTEDEFFRNIIQILSNIVLYESLRKNAYKHVKEKYSWKAISQELEIVYRSIRRGKSLHDGKRLVRS